MFCNSDRKLMTKFSMARMKVEELYDRTKKILDVFGLGFFTTESVGVKPDAIDKIAEMSIDDPTAGGNPVKVTVDYSRQVLEASLAGTV